MIFYPLVKKISAIHQNFALNHIHQKIRILCAELLFQ